MRTVDDALALQVMSGDNWVEVMMRDMLVLNSKGGTLGLVVASLFYLFFFFFAQYVVVNLFIAVILESFDIEAAARSSNRALGISSQYDMSKVRTKLRQGMPQSLSKLFKPQGKGGHGDGDGENRVHPDGGDDDDRVLAQLEEVQKMEGRDGARAMFEEKSHEQVYAELVESEMGEPTLSQTARVCSGVDVKSFFEGHIDMEHRFVNSSSDMRSLSKALDSKEQNKVVERERVIFFLDPSSLVAKTVIRIADHQLFDNLIGLAILFSCIFLAIDSPDPAIQTSVFLTQAQLDTGNIVCVAVFTFEFVIRSLSDGIIFTKRAYFRSMWNVVDFIVLAISIVDILRSSSGAAGSVRALRILRALRPLRVMKHNPGMRQIIKAISQTLRPVFFVMLFMCFFLACFAFIGMNLFGGKFQRCNLEEDFDMALCSGMAMVEEGGPDDAMGGQDSTGCPGCYLPLVWHTRHFNDPNRSSESFDTFYDSFLTVFQISTNHFSDVMMDGISTTSEGMAPERNASTANFVYFFFLVLLSAFFITNLVVAFIIDGFTSAHIQMSEDAKMAKAMRDYEQAVDQVAKKLLNETDVPSHPARRLFRPLVESRWFELVSSACVFVNVSIMCLYHRNQSQVLADFIETQNTVFLGLLVSEVLLKIWASGVRNFIQRGWNLFDLLIMLAGLLALVISASPKYSQLVRCLRFIRILRLFKSIKAIRVMLETLTGSIGPLANIVLLLLLLLSMFAIFAVQSFGLLRQGQLVSYESSTTDLATVNFRTYSNAMRVLFQILMGDDWHKMMYDSMAAPPFCTPDGDPSLPPCAGSGCIPAGDCGPGQVTTLIFWILFYVMVQYIMMNIFIAAVLDLFAQANIEENSFISDSQMELMAMIWRKRRFANGGVFLPLNLVKPLLKNIPRPVGFLGDSDHQHPSVMDERAIALIKGELSVIVALRRREVEGRGEFKGVWARRFSSSRSVASVEGGVVTAKESGKGGGGGGAEGGSSNSHQLTWSDRIRNLIPAKWRAKWFDTYSPAVLELLYKHNAVTFDEVFMATMCWHAPLAVPQRTKLARVPVCVEAYRHAAAYVIKEVLMNNASRCILSSLVS
jgi:hypothetical protein